MTWKEAVKGDTVRLHVSLDSLLALPEGAVWIEKNGRTEARLGVVRAEKNGGGLRPMVTVEVVSDPLEREVERVTKTVGVVTKAESSRASVDEQVTKTEERWWQRCGLSMMAALAVVLCAVVWLRMRGNHNS